MGATCTKTTRQKFNYILFCNDTNINNIEDVNKINIEKLQNEGQLLIVSAAKDYLSFNDIENGLKHAGNNTQIILFTHALIYPDTKESLIQVYGQVGPDKAAEKTLGYTHVSYLIEAFIKTLNVKNIGFHIVSCHASYGTNEIADNLSKNKFNNSKIENFDLYLHCNISTLSTQSAYKIISHILSNDFSDVQSKYKFMSTLIEKYYFTNVIHTSKSKGKLIKKIYIPEKLDLIDLDLRAQINKSFEKIYSFYEEIKDQNENSKLNSHKLAFEKFNLEDYLNDYLHFFTKETAPSNIFDENFVKVYNEKISILKTFVNYLHDLVKNNVIDQKLCDSVILESLALQLVSNELCRVSSAIENVLDILLTNPVTLYTNEDTFNFLLTSYQMKHAYTNKVFNDKNLTIKCLNEAAFKKLIVSIFSYNINEENIKFLINKIDFAFNFKQLAEYVEQDISFALLIGENKQSEADFKLVIDTLCNKLNSSEVQIAEVQDAPMTEGINCLKEEQNISFNEDSKSLIGGHEIDL